MALILVCLHVCMFGSGFGSGFLLSNKVAKNKIAPPFRVVEMDILFGTGIDTVSCLLDAAEDAGIFTRKGSWYSYNDKNVAQVRVALRALRFEGRRRNDRDFRCPLSRSSSPFCLDRCCPCLCEARVRRGPTIAENTAHLNG